MKKRLVPLLRAYFRLPSSIQSEVRRYYVCKLIGKKPSDHQTIWTSFFYFAAENAVRTTIVSGGLYKVEFDHSGIRNVAFVRPGSSSDIFVFFQIFIANGYKPLTDILTKHPQKSFVIVDAGANVGYFSLLMRNLYPNARIICIEPHPGNFAQLEINLPRQDTNTVLVRAALWPTDTNLDFKNAEAHEWSFQMKESNSSKPEIQGVSLDLLMNSLAIKHIDILKMDIEGAEGALFADSGFLASLNRVNCVALEIHDELSDRKAIHEKLLSKGFGISEQGELTTAVKPNL